MCLGLILWQPGFESGSRESFYPLFFQLISIKIQDPNLPILSVCLFIYGVCLCVGVWLCVSVSGVGCCMVVCWCMVVLVYGSVLVYG